MRTNANKRTQTQTNADLLGPVLGRTDFSRAFVLEPPDFSWILSPDSFSFFAGKSAERNPPGKSPAKSSKAYTTKIPNTFLQRGRVKISGSLKWDPTCRQTRTNASKRR